MIKSFLLPVVGFLAGAEFTLAALPFSDGFNNNDPVRTDSQLPIDSPYWNRFPNSVTPGGSQVTESGGMLQLIARGQTTADLFGTAVTPDFNFFNGPITFSISGFSLASSGLGPTPTGAEQQFRFVVQSDANVIQSSVFSGIGLLINGANQIQFGRRIGGSGNVEQSQVLVPLTTVDLSNGAINGFTLTLDATNYQLTITQTGGPGASFSGPHGVAQGNWTPNAATGNSTVSFESFNGAAADSVNLLNNTLVTASIDQFDVNVVPEPGTWALMACGAGLLISVQRFRRSTHKRS